jgi:hypothetical protein
VGDAHDLPAADAKSVPLPVIALAATTVALATATTIHAATSTLRTVHRGQLVTLSLTSPSRTTCVPLITYADKSMQQSSAKVPVDGRLSWRLRIPPRAGLGVATWLVRCGVLWHVSGSWRVVRA